MMNNGGEESYVEKLRAFCEGLRMSNIDSLITKSAADFKAIGEAMANRIVKIKYDGFKSPETPQEMMIVLERAKEIISKERDKLQEMSDRISELLEPLDRGFEAFEEAIDAFSEQF